MRGILPAASLSNVGIYGTGQGYEALLLGDGEAGLELAIAEIPDLVLSDVVT